MGAGVCCDRGQSSDVVVHLLWEHDVAEIAFDRLVALLPRAHLAAPEEASPGGFPDQLGRAEISGGRARCDI